MRKRILARPCTAVLSAVAVSFATNASAQDEDGSGIEARDLIIVTGTRIPRPDAAAASPVASFDREEINTFRSVTIEEFINDLPLVTPDFGRTGNNPGDGTARINLRGLGPQRTLILLNGRRVAPGGTTSAVDINTIPSALLERVEIVSGGASAVYGSDAVTGAVNFITRDDLQGIELSGQFDIFGAGDGETYNASIVAGTSFAGGRGHITVYGDYLNGKPVTSDAREFTSVVIGENRTTGELVERGSFSVPEGAIGFPPAVLDGEIVFPIFNQDGSFREWMFDVETYNFAPANYLQTAIERWSGGAFTDYELSPEIELFSEFMFSQPVTKAQLAPVPANFFGSFAIDSDFFADSTREELRDAYDPDGDGIGNAFLLKRLEEVGPRRSQLSGDYYRAVVGFQSNPAPAWTVDGYYSYSRNDNVGRNDNNVSRSRLVQGLLVDPATGNCVDPSGGCVPVNIFGLGNVSPEAVEFIRLDGVDDESTAVQHNAALIATGELFDWSGGTVLASSGLEFRRNTAEFMPSDVSVDDILGGAATGEAIAGGFSVYEIFAETVIPVFQGRSFAERLEIEAAARFSHYSTAGGSWTWKAGGQWFPVENLRIRGMWQRAVRAPNIEETLRPPRDFGNFLAATEDFCLAVNDPVARGLADVCIAQGMDPSQIGVYDIPPGIDINDYFIPAPQISRGNPDLDPESAGTITVGADYTFDAPFNLQIGADYFDIRLEGAIAQPDDPLALCAIAADPETELCKSLTRRPDGFPIQRILQPLNLSVARVKGVDVNIAFSADAPEFMAPPGGADIGFKTQATHYMEFGRATTAVTPFVDCAGGFENRCGFSTGATTFPDKLVNTTFFYDTPDWGASLRWRWISGQENLAPVFDELSNLPPPNLPVPFIGDRHYLDAAIRFNVADSIEIRAGVDNLLGTDPPQLADEQSQANSDPGRYTVLGRRVFVRLEARLWGN